MPKEIKGKYKIGDKLWTYDYHYDQFIRITVDSSKIVDGYIMYNGMYSEEDLFINLIDSYLHECDYQTQLYKEKLGELEIRLSYTKELLKNEQNV